MQEKLRSSLALIEVPQRPRHAEKTLRRPMHWVTMGPMGNGRETAFWLESGLSAQCSCVEARQTHEKVAKGIADPDWLRLPDQ